MARELHDDLSQQLALVGLAVSNLKRYLPPDSLEASEQTFQINEKLEELLECIRRLSHDLHPPALEYIGLAAALRNYCTEYAALSSHRISFRADDGPSEGIPPTTAICVYRVAQEAVQNSIKHSRVDAVEVLSAARLAEGISLVVLRSRSWIAPRRSKRSGSVQHEGTCPPGQRENRCKWRTRYGRNRHPRRAYSGGYRPVSKAPGECSLTGRASRITPQRTAIRKRACNRATSKRGQLSREGRRIPLCPRNVISGTFSNADKAPSRLDNCWITNGRGESVVNSVRELAHVAVSSPGSASVRVPVPGHPAPDEDDCRNRPHLPQPSTKLARRLDSAPSGAGSLIAQLPDAESGRYGKC